MITSSKNPTIQEIHKLQQSRRSRSAKGVFVIEGIRLVAEALAAGVKPRTLLFTEPLGPRGAQILVKCRASGCEPTLVSENAMAAASDTQTSQGILAVLPLTPLPLPGSPKFILILDGLRDPGNMGTVLRTAAAAGVDAVLLPPGAVDPYNPKVLRAGMGAHFHLPVHILPWEEIAALVRDYEVYLADKNAKTGYTSASLKTPLAIIIGSEAEGASQRAHSLSPVGLQIPMPGEAESLNAAVAAAILIYEVLRQSDHQV